MFFEVPIYWSNEESDLPAPFVNNLYPGLKIFSIANMDNFVGIAELTDLQNVYCAYTVIDGESGERFITVDYCSRQHAHRELEALSRHYPESDLRLAGIDPKGRLHEL